MHTYTYVEDYLELLAGVKPRTHVSSPVMISLARYDTAPVGSFLSQIVSNTGLTDRQAELALKIIAKYERQFAKHGIGLGEVVTNPQYRLPIRKVNRDRLVFIRDGKIGMRFPFMPDVIAEIKRFAMESLTGEVSYQSGSREWQFAMTENCLEFVMELSRMHDFQVDAEVKEVHANVRRVEGEPFTIELTSTADGLTITNAPNSMLEYIDTRLGGLCISNLRTLVDHSDVLGYTVDPRLLTALPLSEYAVRRDIKMLRGAEPISKLVEYANEYRRWPIINYHAGASANEVTAELSSLFDSSEVLYLLDRRRPMPDDISTYKVIHLGAAWAPYWTEPVPLLLTTSNMMFGSSRGWLLQNAGKVCYYCDTFI